MKSDQLQPENQKLSLSKSFAKGVIVWQLFQTIDVFSVSPYSTGVWIFGSLAVSIIFSIFLKRPIDLFYGVIIAAYVVFIDRLPSVPPLLYFIWSFYRLDKQQSDENAQTVPDLYLSDTKFAGVLRRAAAFLIDAIIFVLLYLPFAIAVGGLAANTQPLNPHHQWINVLIVFAFWLVLAAMESSAGATLGKKAMRLSVVDSRGKKITFGAALMRNFVKVPLWTVPNYLFPDVGIMAQLILGIAQIGIFSVSAFTEKHQALYDILVNSIVVRYSPVMRETPANIIIS